MFYTSRTKSGLELFNAPQPYLAQQQNTPTPSSQQQGESLKPIKVAQQFKFIPFEQFTKLLDDLDTWIFSSSTNDVSIKQEAETEKQDRWYASGEPWTNNKDMEPSAVSLQHGLLCSASLCQGILHKLQAMV